MAERFASHLYDPIAPDAFRGAIWFNLKTETSDHRRADFSRARPVHPREITLGSLETFAQSRGLGRRKAAGERRQASLDTSDPT